MSVSLSDLTIILPYRHDTEDRKENLHTLIRYITTHFSEPHIILLESAKQQTCTALSNIEGVDLYYEENSTHFHRTRLFNTGAKQSNRPYIACFDTDVFFKPEAIHDILNTLRKNPDQAFGIPHNGVTWDIKNNTKATFCKTFNFEPLPFVERAKVKEQPHPDLFCMHPMALGGATFFNKDIFLRLGGYNERFISWGWEDNEIISRFTKMGYPPFRSSKSNCYHLFHERKIDSSRKHPFYKFNMAEFKRVNKMDKVELEDYIDTFLVQSNMIRVPASGKNIGNLLRTNPKKHITHTQCPHCHKKVTVDCLAI